MIKIEAHLCDALLMDLQLDRLLRSEWVINNHQAAKTALRVDTGQEGLPACKQLQLLNVDSCFKLSDQLTLVGSPTIFIFLVNFINVEPVVPSC